MNVLALPHRVRDARIVALAAAFGATTPFSLEQATTVLGLSLKEAWSILFFEPLVDDVYRVSGNNGKFWLLPQDPAKAALDHWRARYLPVLRRLDVWFTADVFAKAASIPYPSANFLLSQFASAGIVESSIGGEGGMLAYRLTAPLRRKVKINGLVYGG